jgi:hypothetical protein
MTTKKISLLLYCFFLCVLQFNANAITYYISSTGSNTNDGKSIATAWQTPAKINSTVLLPGDIVLFEGGKIFSGNIILDQSDANDVLRPVAFSSYGTGRATIQTTTSTVAGFKATNTQGINISNLIFRGMAGTSANADGVLFYTNSATGYYSNIQIKNVEVSNFGNCGIRFYSDWNSTVTAGFKRVVVDNCKVFDCREIGITSWGYDIPNVYQNYNIRVTNCEVYNIFGYSANGHKGSGIVLAQVDSALIERCVTYKNGKFNTACGGPGGIWVWSANNVNIQFCESYQNYSGSGKGCDGLGFDLDGGVTNSIIQYCYSHDNDGAGILLGNFQGARDWKNNIVRYNISINDARTNNSPITLFTAPGTVWDGLKFYNNTVYVTPSSSNNYPSFSALQMSDYGNSMMGFECYNNIFQTTGSIPLITIPASFVSSNPKFINNLYWSSGSSFDVSYGGVSYNSLTTWQNGTGREKNGSTPTGIFADPLLTNVSNSAPVIYPLAPEKLAYYKIPNNSPAVDKGLDLTTFQGFTLGNRDYFGNSVLSGAKVDIGACEYQKANSIFSAMANRNVKIIPNPSKGVFLVEFSNSNYDKVNISVSDLAGRELLAIETDDDNFLFGKNNLNAGIYVVSIKCQNTISNTKLIIE